MTEALRGSRTCITVSAAPILEQAVVVLIFVYGERATGSEEADPAAVVAHLDQHGIRAISSKRMVETETVARALLDHAARTQADLLVMGGYGHPRLREMMLGGTTRAVLRAMTRPIFMAH
jgi:nucleotide-binding universal stress UspA family protein